MPWESEPNAGGLLMVKALFVALFLAGGGVIGWLIGVVAAGAMTWSHALAGAGGLAFGLLIEMLEPKKKHAVPRDQEAGQNRE